MTFLRQVLRVTERSTDTSIGIIKYFKHLRIEDDKKLYHNRTITNSVRNLSNFPTQSSLR
jgi:hypothetical protein